MSVWHAVLLGMIQGLTEFLPVSSSGHLVLGEVLLGINDKSIAFEIFAHFGTLLAIITVFRRDLLTIIREVQVSLVFRPKSQNLTPNGGPSSPRSNLFLYLVIATLPAAVIGYLFRGAIESTFAYPEFVCLALIGTGIILLVSRKAQEKLEALDSRRSLLIGLAQVFAFLPGISRSGTTITAGMLIGLHPVEAARFSFLLAIPLILGVTGFKFAELLAGPLDGRQVITLAVGALSAYVSGLLAIKWLLGVVQKGRLDRFAYYCFAVGIIGLLVFGLESTMV